MTAATTEAPSTVLALGSRRCRSGGASRHRSSRGERGARGSSNSSSIKLIIKIIIIKVIEVASSRGEFRRQRPPGPRFSAGLCFTPRRLGRREKQEEEETMVAVVVMMITTTTTTTSTTTSKTETETLPRRLPSSGGRRSRRLCRAPGLLLDEKR